LSEGVLSAGGLGSASERLTFTGVIVVVLFNVYFMIEELVEMRGARLGYFLDAWNVLDWINMILLMVAFVLRIVNFLEAGGAGMGQSLADNVSFSNLRGLAFRAHTVSLLHAINGALLWGKAIKYFRFLPFLRDIIHVVWNAFDLFLPFICMFAVAFVGFAMAYNIGFGDKILELSTFYMSAVYLGRAFLRDIRLMTVYDLATPMFAATLILLYYVTLILVGASFLFAIIADALFHAKFKTHEKPNPHHREQPCEEFAREFQGRWRVVERALRRRFPWLFRLWYRLRRGCLQLLALPGRFLRGESQRQGSKRGPAKPNESASGLPPVKGEVESYDDGSSASGVRAPEPLALPSRANLMRALELMSGRILSEIAIVGIEIRSELHEVCERVAQMQMAVEELTHRADRVREEQEAELH